MPDGLLFRAAAAEIAPAVPGQQAEMLALIETVKREYDRGLAAQEQFLASATTMLDAWIKTGEALFKLQKMVGRGKWGPLVEKHFKFSERHARRYVLIAKNQDVLRDQSGHAMSGFTSLNSVMAFLAKVKQLDDAEEDAATEETNFGSDESQTTCLGKSLFPDDLSEIARLLQPDDAEEDAATEETNFGGADDGKIPVNMIPEILTPPAAVVGKSRVNGVVVDDPPDIAAQRGKGLSEKIVPDVEQPSDEELDEQRGNREKAEERRGIEGEGQTDEEFLAPLPLMKQLEGYLLRDFKLNALFWRLIGSASKKYETETNSAYKQLTPHRDFKGPVRWKVLDACGIPHPRNWRLCPPKTENGCGGSGESGITKLNKGRCPKCHGYGYLIPGLKYR
jgi:hypothetical protein